MERYLLPVIAGFAMILAMAAFGMGSWEGTNTPVHVGYLEAPRDGR